MVILKFPEKYYDSFQTFKKGKYSQMFKDIKDFKFFESHPDTQKVFIKDHNYRIEFTKKVNKIFNTNSSKFGSNGRI